MTMTTGLKGWGSVVTDPRDLCVPTACRGCTPTGNALSQSIRAPHREMMVVRVQGGLVLAMFEGMLGTGKIDYQEAERWEEGKQLGGSHFLSCQWIWKKRRLGIPDGPRDDLRSGLGFPPRPWRHSPGFHETMAKQKPPFISS